MLYFSFYLNIYASKHHKKLFACENQLSNKPDSDLYSHTAAKLTSYRALKVSKTAFSSSQNNKSQTESHICVLFYPRLILLRSLLKNIHPHGAVIVGQASVAYRNSSITEGEVEVGERRGSNWLFRPAG